MSGGLREALEKGPFCDEHTERRLGCPYCDCDQIGRDLLAAHPAEPAPEHNCTADKWVGCPACAAPPQREREVNPPDECSTCLGWVDANGDALGECPVNPPAECDDCGRCLCDGSC